MKYLLSLTIITALLASCHKNSTSAHTSMIRTISTIYGSHNKTDTLYYNNNGFITRQGSSDSSFIDYVYSSNNRSLLEIRGFSPRTGMPTVFTNSVLNSSGLIDSTYEIATGNNSLTSSKYLFDANDHESTLRLYNSAGLLSQIISYTITNDNIANLRIADFMGHVIQTDYYTYSSSIKNTVGSANSGKPFFGRSSLYAPISDLAIAGSDTIPYTYQYTLDANSRIVKVIELSSTGVIAYTRSYTYY